MTVPDYVRLARHEWDLDDDGHEDILSSVTTETDDTLVLAPDGAGGVEFRAETGGGSGAPTTADYLVGTSQGGLSAEIVVGTTPGGELGGTWSSPTVDGTHSGSAHSDFIAKSVLTTQDDIIVRDGTGPARLAKGSDGQVLTVDPTTHHLVWATPSGGGAALTVEEVDGSPTDSAVTKIVFPNGTLGIASHVATYTPIAGFSDPMTTRGDIILRNAANATARLGRGSNGQVLTSDGTDLSWQTPTTGGGGAGADAITGQISAGGAIIPGLQGSPDIRVAATNDDEFDTLDTSDPMTGWTTLGTPTSHNVNSHTKSHYYAKINAAAGTADVGIYKAVPSIPFTVTCKITDAYIRSNYNKAGLFIAEASPGKLEILNISTSSTGPAIGLGVDAHTNRTTYGSTLASITWSGDVPIYFRIVVTSSTNVEYLASANGRIWRSVLAARNPGFTVGSVGLMVASENATYPGEAIFDWIRFT